MKRCLKVSTYLRALLILLGSSLIGGSFSVGSTVAPSTDEAPPTLESTVSTSQLNEGFEDCKDLEEIHLRAEINTLSQELFDTELQGLDLDRAVGAQWAAVGMDDIIRIEVGRGVQRVRDDTGYFTKLWSSWSPGSATELADRVAGYAFGSEGFRHGIEALSGGVAKDITRRFEMTANRSASSASLCMQAFIGSAYGNSVLQVFEQELLTQTVGLDPSTDVSVAGISPTALTGAGIVAIIGGHVARSVMQRVSTRISQRIAGRIALRVAGRAGTAVIPIVGWVVGIGMIAWDLIDGGDGALSSIEEQLTSEEVQEEIRREIVLTIEQELPLASAEIAREIANEVYYQWRDFKDSFQTVLTVADQDPDFNQFLAGVTTDDFYKLSQLADTAGGDELQSAFLDGSLERALALPEASLQILSTTGSIQTVIAWSELARSSLNEVVDFEIYKHKQPDDFTAATLQRLLRTNDATTISKLILLDRAELENVLSISVANINVLAQRLSAEDFGYLSWFMARLDQGASNFLISVWTEKPEAIGRFKTETVQNGIVESSNRVQAIRFVSADPSLWTLYQDVPRVISGNIARKLFFTKYRIDQIIYFFIVSLIVVVVGVLLVRLLTGLLFGSGRVNRPSRERE